MNNKRPPEKTTRALLVDAGPGRSAEIRFTDISDGNFAVSSAPEPNANLDARRSAVAPLPWSWLRQVHGSRVVTVVEPGDHAGVDADASVTDRVGPVLAIQTADCAPVAFVSENGVIGAAHAGWRGIEAGILQLAAAEMRALGAERLSGYLGPCIGPSCYEFGAEDLDRLSHVLGPSIASVTSDGRPALDVPAAVRAALADADVSLDTSLAACTSCSEGLFSHRARGDAGRQALAIWLVDTGEPRSVQSGAAHSRSGGSLR